MEHELLRLGNTASQGIRVGALTLPGESSGVDPLLGRQSLSLCHLEGSGQGGIGGGGLLGDDLLAGVERRTTPGR